MIGNIKEGQHQVAVVNDTRETKSGTVTVHDADSEKTLFSFEVLVSGKTVIGYNPEQEGHAM